MGDFFTELILIAVLAAAVRIATPLILAALGELITERAGILNLGVEGTMLMAAFAGFAGALDDPRKHDDRATGCDGGGAFMAFLMVFMAATRKGRAGGHRVLR